MALPPFMSGMGLELEGQLRWILAMSVVLWLTAMLGQRGRPGTVAAQHGSTFFALALAGNVGAILAADVVSFFVFSVLMGYGFYGVFVDGAGAAARRGARIYVIALVIADQLLFEAALIAATATADVRFSVVRHAVVGTDHVQGYLLYGLCGFALKAGLWPVHVWLPLGYRSTQRSAAGLMGGVPVAMALLGAVRWLPLGQLADVPLGAGLQVLGVAGAAYGAGRLISRRAADSMPAWGVIVGTGIFAALLGRALAVPSVWERYQHWTYLYIAAFGLAALALPFVQDKLRHGRRPLAAMALPENRSSFGPRFTGLLRWSQGRTMRVRSALAFTPRVAEAIRRRTLETGRSGGAGRWDRALLVFIVLGLLLAWLSG